PPPVSYTLSLHDALPISSEQIAVNRYDFVLLDLGLPDYEGLDLIAEIREGNADAALLITTARGAVEDKVKGLDLGADDYLPKPLDRKSTRLNSSHVKISY